MEGELKSCSPTIILSLSRVGRFVYLKLSTVTLENVKTCELNGPLPGL